jgi:hypothetical protein
MKYQDSFNALAFGEIKPYSGSLNDGRLDLVYYRDPSLEVGIRSRFGLCTERFVLPPSRKARHAAGPAEAELWRGRTSASPVEPPSSSSTQE